MTQDPENIEAKLCAYIDDELDDADRAQIEKYLADNPQHRQLIEELSQTHKALGRLPRQPAPTQIAETLQGRMERDVLLGEDEIGMSRRTLRHTRWPQILTAAAMLLITAGLGVAIYLLIHPRPGQIVAVAPQPATPSPQLPTASPEPAESVPPLAVVALAGSAARESAAKDQASPPASPGTVVVVVSTIDPSATSGQLVAYLTANGMHWDAVSESAGAVAAVATSTVQTHVEYANAPRQMDSMKALAKEQPSEKVAAGASTTMRDEQLRQIQAKANKAGYTATAGEQWILVHDLTPQQCTDLTDSLSQPPGQEAKIVDRDDQVSHATALLQQSQALQAGPEVQSTTQPTSKPVSEEPKRVDVVIVLQNQPQPTTEPAAEPTAAPTTAPAAEPATQPIQPAAK